MTRTLPNFPLIMSNLIQRIVFYFVIALYHTLNYAMFSGGRTENRSS